MPADKARQFKSYSQPLETEREIGAGQETKKKEKQQQQ